MTLSRKDRKLLGDLEFNLMATNEASKPSVKASSTERIITSNVRSYDNLDGNSRKYNSMKRYYVDRITDLIGSWNAQLSGEKLYRPEKKQCKSSVCPNPNKRVPLEDEFCRFCGKEYK